MFVGIVAIVLASVGLAAGPRPNPPSHGAAQPRSTPRADGSAVGRSEIEKYYVARTIGVAGDVERTRVVSKEVLEELGYELRPGAGRTLETAWRVLETGQSDPRTARRSRISVSINEESPVRTSPSCDVTLEVEATTQVEEGDGRWTWQPWTREPASDSERAAFEVVVTALAKRLPRPDPDAPPPDDSMPPTRAAPESLPSERIPTFELGKGGIGPMPLFQPMPSYPASARPLRLSGTVVLEILVDHTGQVAEVRVIESSPSFDDAAVEAVEKWRFQPIIVNGKPIRWKGIVRHHFKP